VTTSNAAPRRHAALKHAVLVLAGILALTVVATFVAIVAFVPIWFLVVLIGIEEMALLFLLPFRGVRRVHALALAAAVMKSCRPWPGAVPTSTVLWVTGRPYGRRCVRSVMAEQAEEHERRHKAGALR
jgi:hypothetical protein